MKFNIRYFLTLIVCLLAPCKLMAPGNWQGDWRNKLLGYQKFQPYQSSRSYTGAEEEEKERRTMEADYEKMVQNHPNDPTKLLPFFKKWAPKQHFLNDEGRRQYRSYFQSTHYSIKNFHREQYKKLEADHQRERSQIKSISRTFEDESRDYGQQYDQYGGGYNQGYDSYDQYGNSGYGGVYSNYQYLDNSYQQPVYDPNNFQAMPDLGMYPAAHHRDLGLYPDALPRQLLQPDGRPMEYLPSDAKTVITFDQLTRDLDIAANKVKGIETGFDHIGDSDTARQQLFSEAIGMVKEAVVAANTMRKYSDTTKYVDAGQWLFQRGITDVSNTQADRELLVTSIEVAKILDILIDAREKLKLNFAFGVGLSDIVSIKKYVDVAGLLNDKDAKYLITDLKNNTKWKTFETGRQKAEERLIVKSKGDDKKTVISTTNLDAIIRAILLKGHMISGTDIEYGDQVTSFTNGLAALATFIENQTFKNDLNYPVNKPFKDHEITKIADVLVKAKKRLGGAVTDWRQPYLYDQFLKTMATVLNRMDLMKEIYEKHLQKFKELIGYLPQAANLYGSSTMGRDAEGFFKKFEKLYTKYLLSDEVNKLIDLRARFDRNVGVSMAELIFAGRAIWPMKTDGQKDRFILGMHYLAQIVAKLSLDGAVSDKFALQEKQEDAGWMRNQMVFDNNINLVNLDGTYHVDLPISSQLADMIETLVYRCTKRMHWSGITTSSFKINKSPKVFEELVKLLYLVDGFVQEDQSPKDQQPNNIKFLISGIKKFSTKYYFSRKVKGLLEKMRAKAIQLLRTKPQYSVAEVAGWLNIGTSKEVQKTQITIPNQQLLKPVKTKEGKPLKSAMKKGTKKAVSFAN